MKEFLGVGGYTRQAEGFLSWQHLTFVGSLLVIMTVLAVLLGKQNQNKDEKTKNKVLIRSALLIDGVEIFKIAMLCIRSCSWDAILYNLPLFLCSVQLIAIPLAAFTKGKLREAAIDFVCIFGILGAVFGTIGAGQNYAVYPVLSLDNVASGITHSISGFASLYIMFSKMASLKRKNIWVTFGILGFFCVVAYVANITIDYNYMFLMAGDGTPYDILYNLVGGNKILYPLGVVALFVLYIVVFYWVVSLVRKKKPTPKIQETENIKVNI
jgi:uncharacterized membrane protein YwaF